MLNLKEESYKNFKLPHPEEVLIQLDEDDKRFSSTGIQLHIIQNIVSDRKTKGTVQNISKGVSQVQVGDYVYFAETDGIDIKFKEGTFCLIQEKKILGKNIG